MKWGYKFTSKFSTLKRNFIVIIYNRELYKNVGKYILKKNIYQNSKALFLTRKQKNQFSFSLTSHKPLVTYINIGSTQRKVTHGCMVTKGVKLTVTMQSGFLFLHRLYWQMIYTYCWALFPHKYSRHFPFLKIFSTD